MMKRLMKQAASASETSDNIYRTTRCNMSEDSHTLGLKLFTLAPRNVRSLTPTRLRKRTRFSVSRSVLDPRGSECIYIKIMMRGCNLYGRRRRRLQEGRSTTEYCVKS